MKSEFGEYTELTAAADFARHLSGITTDHLIELTYQERRRIHNLKYFTWVEQQGRSFEEINQQWYDPHYWVEVQSQCEEIDTLIEEFNADVGIN